MENNTQHPHGAPWYLVIILIVIALGASLAAVWLAIGLDEDDAVLQTPIVEMVEDEMDEDEEEVEEVEEEVQEYVTFSADIVSDLSFEYPLGWHLYEQRHFDNPSRVLPQHTIYLSDAPLLSVSPSGGPGLRYDIQIDRMDEGEAYLAEVESIPEWVDATVSEVTIAGKQARWTRYVTDTTDPNVSYEPPFWETIHVFGEEANYRIEYTYSDPSEAEAGVWSKLIETFELN